MATHIGNEGFCKAGNNTIGEVRSFAVTEAAATVDDSALNDTADTHKVGSTSWSGTVTVAYDITDTAQAAMTIGTELAWTFYPTGNSASEAELTGNGTVTGVSHTNSRNELITADFEITGQGALTRGTV